MDNSLSAGSSANMPQSSFLGPINWHLSMLSGMFVPRDTVVSHEEAVSWLRRMAEVVAQSTLREACEDPGLQILVARYNQGISLYELTTEWYRGGAVALSSSLIGVGDITIFTESILGQAKFANASAWW